MSAYDDLLYDDLLRTVDTAYADSTYDNLVILRHALFAIDADARFGAFNDACIDTLAAAKDVKKFKKFSEWYKGVREQMCRDGLITIPAHLQQDVSGNKAIVARIAAIVDDMNF